MRWRKSTRSELPVERLMWGATLTEEGLAQCRSFAAGGTPELGC